MSEPFLGELRMFAFEFAPSGWAFCDGGSLDANQNKDLFALLGTYYGGDGKPFFKLPDLRGKVAGHVYGTNPPYNLGNFGGEARHTLTTHELPHGHTVYGTSDTGTSVVPSGNIFANAGLNAYAVGQPEEAQPLNPATIPAVGGGQAHENMSPYLTLAFCIALRGIRPTKP
jgi:microcystin-dependent protein